MKNVFVGVDVGSVTTKLVALDEDLTLQKSCYGRTNGDPVQAVQRGFAELMAGIPDASILAVGTTGSGRHLAAAMLGADSVKNEITAHAVAAGHEYPAVNTVIEIGGQDSKLIFLRNGIVVDFAMNTVCAAGTGSFLDQQAARLNIPIEQFGALAQMSAQPVRIAGRCGVFAESDMIHKQQMGYPAEDIVAGLCEALARNFVNNLGNGKRIEPPVVFQGGVAANAGMKTAFEKLLGISIMVPPQYEVMGAKGAALLAAEETDGRNSHFRGLDFVLDGFFENRSHVCESCPNQCEVVAICRQSETLAYFGDRCRRWENSLDRRSTGREAILAGKC